MAIFNDRMTSIEMCTNRFDEETKVAFRDLYTKLDEEVNTDPLEMTDQEFMDQHEKTVDNSF
jgi:hypothetical protein